ncbi:MAG: ATP-binding protein [Rhodobacteraceae bacterium]|nr:ATP-binding protein [Paracoccaceae bacterium]
MAIDLKKLEKPKGQRPVIITLFGEGGVGKTTLAAMFPAPVFIRTEDGTTSLIGNDEVSLFPLAQSSEDVLSQIEALATQDHGFKTLVLDSITQLATMIEAEIVAADPKAKSINQAGGGYGAGYNTAAERHRKVREWAGALAYEKGMNVVFIGHADTETMDLPDLDPYTRYSVRMHKKSIPHYTDNSDAVCMVRLKTYTRGEGDKKRAISTGEREIICFPQAASITKNRFGISEPLLFSFDAGNPFDEVVAK